MMGKLRAGHIVEATLWLGFMAFLYIYSFDFDREIEIYKYGASAWPRAILLLIALAAIGQLLFFWRRGEHIVSSTIGKASDDGAETAARDSTHNTVRWYVWTLLLLFIPFVYLNLPEGIANAFSLEKSGLHVLKLICGGVLVVIYGVAIRGNQLGGMIALPILFAAFLQDFGFYAMAPFFILAVMYLMGERRFKWMGLIMVLIFAILIMMFVSLLYVGLPTGNISPFYEFGTTMVNIFQ